MSEPYVKNFMSAFVNVADDLEDQSIVLSVSELSDLAFTADRIQRAISLRLIDIARGGQQDRATLTQLRALLSGAIPPAVELPAARVTPALVEPTARATASPTKEDRSVSGSSVERSETGSAATRTAEPSGVPDDWHTQLREFAELYGQGTVQIAAGVGVVPRAAQKWLHKQSTPSEKSWEAFGAYRARFEREVAGKLPSGSEEEVCPDCGQPRAWFAQEEWWQKHLAYHERHREALRRKLDPIVRQEKERLAEVADSAHEFLGTALIAPDQDGNISISTKTGLRRVTPEGYEKMRAAVYIQDGPFAGIHRLKSAKCTGCGTTVKAGVAADQKWPLVDLCPACAKAAEPSIESVQAVIGPIEQEEVAEAPAPFRVPEGIGRTAPGGVVAPGW